MDLSSALRIQPGDVVAFVGAGGKTSCMRRIMHELAEPSLVIASTTTNIGRLEADLAPNHIVVESASALESILSALDEFSGILFTGPLNDSSDKWTGLDETSLTLLVAKARGAGKGLLVEADGARRKFFKAPAEHEPPIPSQATLVVPVVNVEVLGRELSAEWVHRPGRMAELLGIRAGSTLSTNHVVGVLRHVEGGLKNVPEGARVRVFVNGITTGQHLEDARTIARELVEDERVSSVLLGSTSDDDPVKEVWGKAGIVILGAGGASRFGGPKLLERWRGKGILRQVVENALASGHAPAVVVLGADFEKVSAEIADLPIEIIHNMIWDEGQSTSVKAGLKAIEDRCDAVIFMLADMPAVEPSVLNDLVAAHRGTLDSIIAPLAAGRLGNPVLFDRRTFNDLLSVEGDRGGRSLFDRYPPYPVEANEGVLFDIDTQEDLNAT